VAIAAFIIWIAYGTWQWRRSARLYEKLAEMPTGQRSSRATLLLLGSAVGLMAVFYVISRMSPGVIPVWGWVVIILAGLGFVHAQTLAAAMLISTALKRQ
jgi:protein-S-isoprenylcysteine O-methyltransferase Ste14